MNAPETNPLRVGLVHDWLTGMRGGERVLELLCREYTEARIYTLLHRPGALSTEIERHAIRTSWLQQIPGIEKNYRYFLPVFPAAMRSLRPSDVELVISTSHCVAKGVRPPPGARHLCYCFTPMRYAWTFYEEYFGSNPFKRMCLSPVLAGLRRWDRRSSDRVDLFVAISRHVRERIRRFYNRDADVVYPPVDTARCRLPEGTGEKEGTGTFDLMVSALVPYKRIDLAVRAYNRLGFPLKIVGTGTEYEDLRKEAEANIQFLGWKSDAEIVSLYQKCRCLVFPGEEDFGIVPVEAQACGRPVVAYGRGGALETVIPGKTGILFEKQDEDSLLQAVEECASRRWDAGRIRRHAECFSIPVFWDGLRRSIRKCLGSSDGD